MKTHKTAVVIIPPGEVLEPIQEIRKVHDRQFRRWMPHITLIYPFRPRKYFPIIAREMRPAASNASPFEVGLKELSFFEHSSGRCTLWLVPEPGAKLGELRESLVQVVPDCDDVARFRNGFTPHLSVGQAEGKREAVELIEELEKGWEPRSFKVTEASFISRGDPPNDIFQKNLSIELGQE